MEKKYENSNVLITGGLGFIGSNLTTRLVGTGANVTLFDSLEPKYGGSLFNISSVKKEINIINNDIRDSKELQRSVENQDYIFHLAAQLSRPVSVNKPIYDSRINCLGSLELLEAVRQSDSTPSVVYSSSQAVFGKPTTLPLTENSRENPIDIYGVNKLASERYFYLYHKIHGISTNTLRLTNVYGPRAQLINPKYGVINKFIRAAIEDNELTVYEPGTMTRDLVFVYDVVDALMKAGVQDPSGENYIIGSGKSISIKELANMIVDIAGSGTVTMTSWPEDWDSIQVGDLRFDISKATVELDWEPTISLHDGLVETIQFYQRNKDNYLK